MSARTTRIPMLFHRFGQILRTPLGRRILTTHFLVAFGAVSGIIEFLATIFRWFLPHPAVVFAVSLVACLIWALARAYPRFYLHHQLRHPDVVLSVVVGDLFDQETHLAIGFSDTFDTSITNDRVIHSTSVQGQLLQRVFAGNRRRLDQQLAAALSSRSLVQTESRSEKPYGKLVRYPIGTVAVLGDPRRQIFAVAYGHMGNDLVVRAPVEDLWRCFSRLWDAVYRNGQRGALSIPLMGSGLARIDSLHRDNLVRLLLLSFVSHSRLGLVCHELRIVIPPEDVRRVDLVSLREFLHAL
jgi:hypothetical protein